MDYSRTMGCRLLFAVYWTRWNIWTLVDELKLKTVGSVRRLALGDARLPALRTLESNKPFILEPCLNHDGVGLAEHPACTVALPRLWVSEQEMQFGVGCSGFDRTAADLRPNPKTAGSMIVA